MGYDMTMVSTPPEYRAQQEAYEQAFRKYYANPNEVPFPQISQPGYFRLNIWGMGDYRDYMSAFGMLCDEDTPMPEFSQDLVEGPSVSGGIGIPYYKFCSNDGWLVRPEEIRQALEAYDSHPRTLVENVIGAEGLAYWDRWIAFLRTAADNDGFKVW